MFVFEFLHGQKKQKQKLDTPPMKTLERELTAHLFQF